MTLTALEYMSIITTILTFILLMFIVYFWYNHLSVYNTLDKQMKNNETVKDANLSFFKKLININSSQDKLITDLKKNLDKNSKNIDTNIKNISKHRSQADAAHENMEAMMNTRFTELSDNITLNSNSINSFYDTLSDEMNSMTAENRSLIKKLDEKVKTNKINISNNKTAISDNKSMADTAHENMEKLFNDKFSLVKTDLYSLDKRLTDIEEEA